jgi:integrase
MQLRTLNKVSVQLIFPLSANVNYRFFSALVTAATLVLPVSFRIVPSVALGENSGLRPSEQIALAVSDLDIVHGVISINKARVAGIDRALTKTGNDRRVELCARALVVLKRQLRLRTRLIAAGHIDHDHVFFQETGEPIRNLQFPQVRWRRTLRSLKLRYRRPYVARHSSVSWNLMIGKNLLWVSKQHGHSIDTMLRVYATWIEDTSDCDVAAIKRGIRSRPSHLTRFSTSGASLRTPSPTTALAGAHAGRPGNAKSWRRAEILAASLAAPSSATS